jgi:hypothetical protein
MSHVRAITCLLLLCATLAIGTQSASAETKKTEGSKGVTVEDLGRGLKSAEQNVEKEIPKIGPAIGEAFKKHTNKESDKQPAQSPAKEKK